MIPKPFMDNMKGVPEVQERIYERLVRYGLATGNPKAKTSLILTEKGNDFFSTLKRLVHEEDQLTALMAIWLTGDGKWVNKSTDSN
jgi:hypothetical protein